MIKRKVFFLFILLQKVIIAQNILMIPDTLSGTNINLTIQNGSIVFYPGFNTNTIGINGSILGPTLILNKGDNVTINVANKLTDTTTIHWHGMHVAPENDGGPHTVILPGTTWSPHFTVLDNASTYWYHPHLHKKTAEHVTKGAAGFVIVRDTQEKALSLPRNYGVDDIPIVIQSRAFDTTKQFIVRSELDSVILVNGTKNPYFNIPSQVIRLRLLNGSTERTYNLGFTGDKSFYQIGGDGGLLDKPVILTRIRIAPGERAEILIDFSLNKGETYFLKSFSSELASGIIGAKSLGMGVGLPEYNDNKLNGVDFNILRLNVVSSTTNGTTAIPKTLITNKPWDILTSKITRTLMFSSASGMMSVAGPFLINGVSFSMERINYSIPLNNVEIWELRNQTLIAHPFHIHDVQFYLLSRNGIMANENEQGRKDVVLVEPMETVRFITKFEDFSNSKVPYMYHCHLLTHEDDGMMGQFIVDQTLNVNKDDRAIPAEFTLEQNYPNPFNAGTNIHYNLKERGFISLRLFDAIGKEIVTLVNEYKESGYYSQFFDGSGYSSGTYFYQLKFNNSITVRKMILLK